MGRASSGRTAAAIAGSLLLALPACPGDDGPAAGTETEGSGSSSGSGPDSADSTGLDPNACTPGQARACYEGPPGTEGVGACAAGQQVCQPDGATWSACEGQTWPEPAERCDTPADDDCDGWSVCEPAVEWVLPIPGAVHVVAAGPNGHVAVAGTDGFGTFEGEPLGGMFVMLLDAAGTLQWARSVPVGSFLVPHAIAVDHAGAVTVVGSYQGVPDLGGGSLPPSLANDAYAVRYAPDGTHQWDHVDRTDGYYSAALGPDGMLYVGGGEVLEDDGESEPIQASFFVRAIDPSGQEAWRTLGRGGFGIATQSLSVAVTEAGEVALAVALFGFDFDLGGVPIETGDEQVVVVARLDVDGSVIDHRLVPEALPLSIDTVDLVAHPGGLVVAASVIDVHEQLGYAWQAMRVTLDPALQPLTEHRFGQDARVRAMAVDAAGNTVLGMEFSGVLELGAVGVGVPSYQQTSAVAAVDDDGHARWVEVLYTTAATDVPTLAVAPDDAVVLGGYAFGNGTSVLGVELEGPFVAKLQP